MALGSRGSPVLFSVSGPYGVGKDTVLNAIAARFPTRVYRVRALTTRVLVPGVDQFYECVSIDELACRTASGGWIVNQQLSNSVWYATSVDEIESAVANNLIGIQHIFAGPHGAGRLREVFGCRLFSIGLLPGGGSIEDQLAVLAARLAKRNRDDPASMQKRLEHQHEPIKYVMDNYEVSTPHGRMCVFDEVMINDDLDSTVFRLIELFSRRLLLDDGSCPVPR